MGRKSANGMELSFPKRQAVVQDDRGEDLMLRQGASTPNDRAHARAVRRKTTRFWSSGEMKTDATMSRPSSAFGPVTGKSTLSPKAAILTNPVSWL